MATTEVSAIVFFTLFFEVRFPVEGALTKKRPLDNFFQSF